MSRLSRLVACIALTVGLSSAGCSTLKSLGSDDPTTPKIYGGVRLLMKGQSEADTARDKLGEHVVLAILDLPLCAIFDTLLLPVTVFLEPESPEELRRKREREDSGPEEGENDRDGQEARDREWS